jgi:N-acetyl-1-D-myo-inositol-2-amino-2-deoxy-alpha-D-glucopyranoside deacetylase
MDGTMSGDAVISGVGEWFAGLSRVLFVHAHPDDETIATGGTLAGLAAAGREPLLVTLTRGEQGEVTDGPFAGLTGESLAAHRETELAAALFMLGVEHHAYLGTAPARADGRVRRRYEDSGMQWSTPADGGEPVAVAAEDVGPSALTRADAVDPLTDLLSLADHWGARAIVSYDATGGYGHPDHVFAHRAARAVAAGLELPFWEIVPAPPHPVAKHAVPDPVEALRSGEADDYFELHRVEPWLDRKVAALRSHGTQLTVEQTADGFDIVHVGGQRQPVDRLEGFRLLGLE